MASEATATERRAARRELLGRYLRLQRELIEADPAAPSYQATVHAFRNMGYSLITSGFGEDLDRLLRIRVLNGGLTKPASPGQRDFSTDMLLVDPQPRTDRQP